VPTSDTVAALIDLWFRRQQSMPANSEMRRANSTLAENEREAKMLKKAFGHMRSDLVEKADAYSYLDACMASGRPAKGNKEIALMRTIFEHGIRIGKLKVNPFSGVEKNVTRATSRLVTDIELTLAVEVGRRLGGARYIVALALKTAWLCLRRSVEVRALTRDQIGADGIRWTAAKRKRGTAQIEGLIEWSPELKATMDEALAVKRNKLAGSWYVFGNLQGQKYTKGGWKSGLSDLMAACVDEAKERAIPFMSFNLQDCRPKGVSDKLDRGDSDVMEATMHTSERMIKQFYDRRRTRVAKPVK
jgi:integrase